MKRRLVYLSALVLGLATAGIARAAVQPVVFFINNNVPTYTVPTGKVLIIENLSAWAANNAPPVKRIVLKTQLYSNGGTLTSDWGYPITDQYQEVALTRPIRIPAGGIIGIDYANNVGYNEIHFMCLLVDAADLYAANVGGNVDNLAAAGGTLSATVNLASARPVRVSSQTSTDLSTWSPSPTGTLQRTPAPSVWNLQAATDANQKFVKVTAKAPESEPAVPKKP